MHSLGHDGPFVYIYRPEWELTTSKTFTMEYWRVMDRMSGREIADLYDSKQVLTLFF